MGHDSDQPLSCAAHVAVICTAPAPQAPAALVAVRGVPPWPCCTAISLYRHIYIAVPLLLLPAGPNSTLVAFRGLPYGRTGAFSLNLWVRKPQGGGGVGAPATPLGPFEYLLSHADVEPLTPASNNYSAFVPNQVRGMPFGWGAASAQPTTATTMWDGPCHGGERTCACVGATAACPPSLRPSPSPPPARSAVPRDGWLSICQHPGPWRSLRRACMPLAP